VIGLVGCATANASHEPLESDRPDFTESASTVGPGEVQAEAGYTFSRTAGEKTSTAGEVLLRVGITHGAELRLEPGSYAWVSSPTGRQTGRQDGEIGAKVRLHSAADDRPSPDPNVSLVLATSVATGTDAFRQSRAEPEVKLAGEWTLTPHVGLGVNFDVARPVDGARRYTELAASASFGFSVSPRIGAFAEAFGFAPESAGAKRHGYLDTGLTALLSPNLQLDMRGGWGLNGAGPDYFVGAGIVRRW
jgi:hypothetical protein